MTDKTVAPDTDNLDDFRTLFEGKAQVAPVEEPKIEDEPAEEIEDEDTTEDTEDDTPLADETPDEDAEADDKPEPVVKKKKSIQERINELTADKHERDRIIEEERNRASTLEAKLNEVLAKLDKTDKIEDTQSQPATAEGEPSPFDVLEDGSDKYPLGEFDPQYLKDLTNYMFDQRMAEQERVNQEKAVKTEQEKAEQVLKDQWKGRVEATLENLPDFEEKVRSLGPVVADVPEEFGEFLASTIMSLEQGPEILYYLADNPDVARGIISSGPVGAAIAIGEIKSNLTSKKAAPRKVTEAPEPISDSRVRGAGGKFTVPDDTDDLEAFRAKWNKTR